MICSPTSPQKPSLHEALGSALLLDGNYHIWWWSLSKCSLWRKPRRSRGDLWSLSTSSESFNPGQTQQAHQQARASAKQAKHATMEREDREKFCSFYELQGVAMWSHIYSVLWQLSQLQSMIWMNKEVLMAVNRGGWGVKLETRDVHVIFSWKDQVFFFLFPSKLFFTGIMFLWTKNSIHVLIHITCTNLSHLTRVPTWYLYGHEILILLLHPFLLI